MTAATPAAPTMTTSRPLTTAAEAEELATHYVDVMDTLIGVIQQETDLVRVGRLSQTATLEQAKTELAKADEQQAKTNSRDERYFARGLQHVEVS